MKVPLVKISGATSWRELGRQHGAAIAERIRATSTFYMDFFRQKWHFTESEIEEQCQGFATSIRNFNPAYTEELEGIAEGANMPAWQVYTLNCRTELLNYKKSLLEGADASSAPSECTALCNARAGLLAQNWDWDETLEDLVVLMLMDKPDGSQIMMLTEPGIIGKIGMNSAGVGVTLNLLTEKAPAPPPGTVPPPNYGVPIHIILRMVLDSHSVGDALAKLRALPQRMRDTASCIIMADRTSTCHMLEFSRETMDEIKCLPATDKCPSRPFSHSIPFHTNHYLGCGLQNQVTGSESSYARFHTLDGLLQQLSGPPLLPDIHKMLADRSNAEYPIQRPYKLDTYELMSGTISTIIMDLHRGVFHLTRGNPYENPLEAVRAPWAAKWQCGDFHACDGGWVAREPVNGPTCMPCRAVEGTVDLPLHDRCPPFSC
ncbi:unnamed protein product [Vitrella brassicaformis CCMP3155]|uniref:Peptidase C45 hydrolase domain-containing protein n=1 Tax=Vitrella brassicaformis (strain CCMP3155) TaxID=1169540 RepID=A0A0G4EY58_VITBC|nr:unnamed protein product [Vitrella brassicaformis CCMP3155]|mmetsp:Transcript_4221/g.10986  ORF Transcript_4221/g.10986 Transcript_4221/m.10986 type:complete len:432 (-) Transcript_4221:58-1353(-)|eukprot:CEM03365.1 unnamed protein product [Vitrella brassicaformis CCMP3155]